MTHSDWVSLLNAKRVGENQYDAKCPAHDDRHASLRISTAEPDKTLLHCHAGCTTETIVAAVGKTMADLYTEGRKTNVQTTRPIASYPYTDITGKVQLEKRRFAGKDFRWYRETPNGWESGIGGVTPALFNTMDVTDADTVFWVEGEKDCCTMMKYERPAVCLHSGAAGKPTVEQLEPLRGKDVVILPDNDEPGRKHAQNVAAALQGIARSVKVLDLTKIDPALPLKGDITDLIELHDAAILTRVEAMAKELPEWKPEDEAKAPDSPQEKEPRTTQAETLLELVAASGATFFHSDQGEYYAAVPMAGHTEILPITGNDFNIWLCGLFYREKSKAAGREAIQQVVAVLSAEARFGNPNPITMHTRIAEKDGAYWYDLTNSEWQAVQIGQSGWNISNSPPTLFDRFSHQTAQAMPTAGGDISKVLRYVNIKSGETLFLCWLVCCLVPGIPHPMPIFYGEKGAAKSTTSALLKALIDPSALETLSIPKDMKSLIVSLRQHWFVPFDNVSHIGAEDSDALCRAITGGGIQLRKLYTDRDDTIFTFMRCLALNGINNVATRADLLDRSLLIELERIPENSRRELSVVRAEFEADRSSILGGMFDALAKAMAIYPTVNLKRLPRMADFARWGYAVGEALGGKGAEFLDQYAENRKTQNEEAINSDPVASLIVAFMGTRDTWEGRPSELLASLRVLAPTQEINTYQKSFPQQPNSLSRRLRGLKSNLEAVGIMCDNAGHGREGTSISLKNRKNTVTTVTPSQTITQQRFAP